MRILGIETTSPRCSVALVEQGHVVASAPLSSPDSRAEHTLAAIDGLFTQAGWQKSSLERIGAGIGPGSFTGVRVGIALAEGIAAGLGISVVGVGSLKAMALAVSSEDKRIRCPVMDARRGELFVAAYDANGNELWSPRLIAQTAAPSTIAQALGANYVLLGAAAHGVDAPHLVDDLTDYPHASVIALHAQHIAPDGMPVLPQYIREADAIIPNLPPSPLNQERKP
ncbi:MAG TPA: tRNA (adenosine(37)-N6)-threonylcarbamoyltransferase complex dimerization subunit type 1 TsaB [Polyangiaceae bacterium]|nr:tRNA (adenosine(37)-N6)-threonylcarbamoyltransferase complex dimerization subunit type 1 TsaB [Polyangiaceae bacterium]